MTDVHRVGDRLHRGRGANRPVARYAGTTSLTFVAATNRAIGSPARLAISPAVRLPKFPLGVQTVISANRAELLLRLRDGVKVVDHLRQQPADVHRVRRGQAHLPRGGRRSRTPPS